MKKLLYTLTLALIFLSSVSPVFAWSGSCKTITINATDKAISVVVSGCAAFSTADKDHVYRVMASEKDFAATKASSDPYTYEIKEATKDESFSKQLAASKDEYHSGTGGYGGVGGSAGFSTTHTFKYVSIIEFANSTDTDPAKGSLVKEQKIIAPVTFRDLIVTSENADGYTTVDGGIKTNGDIGPYKTKIRLATSTDPAFPPGKTDYYTKGFSLKDDGTFSFVANDLYTKRNPGETMYLKQFYYDPITGEAVWDSKYSSANKIFGNDIAAQTDDLEKHSYTLLSSLAQDKPTIFYDPGSKSCDVAESSLCDFSSVLNFVIKLMIGAAVVFLIISLMIDGFKYMLTDIAGVKSEAKKTIMDKGLGLLIALSSYVILRTINPTLVDNTLSIDQVTITRMSVEESQQRIASILSGSVPSPRASTLKTGETKKIQVTCYITAMESDFSGSQISEVKDASGGLIARAKLGFFDKTKPLSPLFVEGAGVLADGRIVTVANNSKTDPRYKITSAPMGAYGTLSPMQSIAVDPSLIAPGSLVEIAYFKDKTVRYIDKDGSIKSFKQDGKFTAIDTGGALKGAPHIDVYAGFGNKTLAESGCNTFAGGTTSGQKYLDIKILRQGK